MLNNNVVSFEVLNNRAQVCTLRPRPILEPCGPGDVVRMIIVKVSKYLISNVRSKAETSDTNTVCCLALWSLVKQYNLLHVFVEFYLCKKKDLVKTVLEVLCTMDISETV